MSVVNPTLAVFTPDAVAPELLDQLTVARSAELGVLDDAFQAARSTGARPTVLVVGPRGSGKTHLLTVAEHRLRTTDSDPLVVVRMPEDSYRITSYRTLLAATLRQLQGAPPTLHGDDDAVERQLLDALGGRVLVWMIENFDRVLKVLGVPGQRQLRALLHNYGPAVLVASTPGLVPALSSHDAPFYGAFRVIQLGELSVEDGRKLLTRVARLRNEPDLVEFLESDLGLRRLRAVADLAGGLPRLWHPLASCMTVPALDELVPLFVRLLDQLTPYYKARLDELSVAKANLVAHLAQSPGGAVTVTELAAATEVTNQVASKQLGELERARWVRSMKVPGADQRTTYYELREPLLRHCLELKESRGKPLSVIVTALRDWHEATALRDALTTARAGSIAERYLAAALNVARVTINDSVGSPVDFLASARRQLADAAEGALTWIGAVVAEAAVLAEWEGAEPAWAAAKTRIARTPIPGAKGVVEAVIGGDQGASGRDAPAARTVPRIARRLAAASASVSAAELPLADRVNLAQLSVEWLLESDSGFGLLLQESERLIRLAADSADDRLRLAAVQAKLAALQAAGEFERALEAGVQAEAEAAARFGRVDPVTLGLRLGVANLAGVAGDASGARDRLTSVIADAISVLSPDDEALLVTRYALGHWTAEAGDLSAGCSLLASLLADQARVLGPTHRMTTMTAVEVGQLIARLDDGPERLGELPVQASSGRAQRTIAMVAGTAVGIWARRVIDRIAEEPTDGAAETRALLMRLQYMHTAFCFALVVAVAMAGKLATVPVLVDALVQAGAAEHLPAVFAAYPAPSGEARSVIEPWLAAIADRTDPSLALAQRVLGAALALLDGDESLLAALPHEERLLARAAAGRPVS